MSVAEGHVSEFQVKGSNKDVSETQRFLCKGQCNTVLCWPLQNITPGLQEDLRHALDTKYKQGPTIRILNI
jgi:hypothetical protein